VGDAALTSSRGVSSSAAESTLTVAQASQLLKVSDQTIRNMLERHELEGQAKLVNERHRWTVSAASVHRRLAQQAEEADRAAARERSGSTSPPEEDGPVGVLARLIDEMRWRVQDLEKRLVEAEQRVDAERRRADELASRSATLEAALVFQSEAKEELLAAFDAQLQAQQSLSRMARAERRTADQFMHDVSMGS
jgi:hypothetical protein